MDKRAVILGKKVVSRKETLEYLSRKFGWENCIIGISAYYGFLAWVWGRLTRRKVIYYCIDFYAPTEAENWKDRIFIWLAMQMDKFLNKHCDDAWDISKTIDEGRYIYGGYTGQKSRILPLCYPPDYFRFNTPLDKKLLVYVGLDGFGTELAKDYPGFVWLGKGKLPLDILLKNLSICGMGLAMWNTIGNNYYGDPGKTKLYSACGLPVIMTNNTLYSKVIEDTQACIIIPYDKVALKEAIKKMLNQYDFYKGNVKKTWRYINADEVFEGNNL